MSNGTQTPWPIGTLESFGDIRRRWEERHMQMVNQLAEAREAQHAAQDRANRAEEALREIVETVPAKAPPFLMIGAIIRSAINRHGALGK